MKPYLCDLHLRHRCAESRDSVSNRPMETRKCQMSSVKRPFRLGLSELLIDLGIYSVRPFRGREAQNYMTGLRKRRPCLARRYSKQPEDMPKVSRLQSLVGDARLVVKREHSPVAPLHVLTLDPRCSSYVKEHERIDAIQGNSSLSTKNSHLRKLAIICSESIFPITNFLLCLAANETFPIQQRIEDLPFPRKLAAPLQACR